MLYTLYCLRPGQQPALCEYCPDTNTCYEVFAALTDAEAAAAQSNAAAIEQGWPTRYQAAPMPRGVVTYRPGSDTPEFYEG